MGVIRRGILGGFSGKVANVVGSSWKGIATLKSLPLSVANPNTAGQVVQRTRMTNVVAFAKAILVGIIKPLNDRFASGQSGFNLFVSRNIALFDDPNPLPVSDLIVSEGTVTPALGFSVVADVSLGTAVGSWPDNTGSGNALAGDVAFIFHYNVQRNTFSEVTSAIRSAESASANIPENSTAGDTVISYISFRRADGSQVSNSLDSQVTVIA